MYSMCVRSVYIDGGSQGGGKKIHQQFVFNFLPRGFPQVLRPPPGLLSPRCKRMSFLAEIFAYIFFLHERTLFRVSVSLDVGVNPSVCLTTF
jgi:hypothetical protein